MVALAPGHLLDRVPVGHDQPVEIELLLEHPGHQRAVAVQLAQRLRPARRPRVVADHHGGRSGIERGVIPRAVNGGELCGVAAVLTLVDALERPAIADEVLHAGGNIALAGQFALQPAHQRAAQFRDHGGIAGIAFIGAAPALILHHGDGGREGPADPGGADLLRGRPPDPLDQIGIVRRAQPDIVREHRCPHHIVVAMNRVGAPDQRDLHRHVGGQRRLRIGIGQTGPVGQAGVLVHPRPGPAAVQDRTDVVLAHLIGRDRADFGLGHLPDLLLQRHPRHDLRDPRLHGRIDRLGRRAGRKRGDDFRLAGTPFRRWRFSRRCRRGRNGFARTAAGRQQRDQRKGKQSLRARGI